MLRSAKDSLVYQYSKACMTFHRLSLYRHIDGLPYRHTVGLWVAVAHAGAISDVLMPYRSNKERSACIIAHSIQLNTLCSLPLPFCIGRGQYEYFDENFPLSFCLGKGISYGYYACCSRLIYIKFQVAVVIA